jgi:hypothetical protein
MKAEAGGSIKTFRIGLRPVPSGKGITGGPRVPLDFAAPGPGQDPDDKSQQRGFEQKGSKGEGVCWSDLAFAYLGSLCSNLFAYFRFKRAMEPDLSPSLSSDQATFREAREQAGAPMLLCLQAQQGRFRLVSHSCTRLAE